MRQIIPGALLMSLLIPPAASAGILAFNDLDAGETTADQRWFGGGGTAQVSGTFAGGPTVDLEWTGGLGFQLVDGCSFTAAGLCDFTKAEGSLRVVVTGGSGSAIASLRVAGPHQASAVGGGGVGGLQARIQNAFDSDTSGEVETSGEFHLNLGTPGTEPHFTFDLLGGPRIDMQGRVILHAPLNGFLTVTADVKTDFSGNLEFGVGGGILDSDAVGRMTISSIDSIRMDRNNVRVLDISGSQFVMHPDSVRAAKLDTGAGTAAFFPALNKNLSSGTATFRWSNSFVGAIDTTDGVKTTSATDIWSSFGAHTSAPTCSAAACMYFDTTPPGALCLWFAGVWTPISVAPLTGTCV